MLVSVQFPAIFFQKTFVSEGITQQGHSWQELAPHYATEPKVSEVNEPWKLRTPYWAWSLVSARTFGQPSYAIKEEKVGVYVLEGWRSVLLVPFPGSHFAHKDTRRMLKISKRENLHLPHYQLWSMLLLRLGFIFSGKSLMQALREHQPACTYGGPYLSDSPFSAVLQAPSSLNPRSTTPLQLVLGEIFGSQRFHSKLKELDQWVFPSQLSTGRWRKTNEAVKAQSSEYVFEMERDSLYKEIAKEEWSGLTAGSYLNTVHRETAVARCSLGSLMGVLSRSPFQTGDQPVSQACLGWRQLIQGIHRFHSCNLTALNFGLWGFTPRGDKTTLVFITCLQVIRKEHFSSLSHHAWSSFVLFCFFGFSLSHPPLSLSQVRLSWVSD